MGYENENAPLDAAEMEYVKQTCLLTPGLRWNDAVRQYKLSRLRRPTPQTPLKASPGAGTVVQDLVNDEPESVTTQAALKYRLASVRRLANDSDPRIVRFARDTADIMEMEQDIEATLARIEARNGGDVPSESYRKTAEAAQRDSYAKKALKTNLVKKYALQQMSRGRHIKYAQAEREVEAIARGEKPEDMR